MKRWCLQLFIFISLLFIAGCSGNGNDNDNNNTNTNKKTFPGPDQPVYSRFAEKPEYETNETADQKSVAEEDLQYFRPTTDRIAKQGMISSNIDLKITRQSEKHPSYFEKSPFRQETVSFTQNKVSPEVYFTAVFDNDIFDYTDCYYTNGISLELFHPAIGNSPICRALPGLKNSLNYYSLNLVQNMYTPLKLEDLEARVGDRPFAAYMTIGHQRISLSQRAQRRLQSELDIGAIGSASLGGVAQDMIHSNTPVGWVNQVKNDFVVNYSIRFDQGIYRGKGIDIAVFTGGQAGTLYDNIIAGLNLMIGKFNDRYQSVFQTTPHQKTFRKRIRYYFEFDLKNKVVMYDATLQGGMINKTSVYTLTSSQVNRYVFTGIVSFGLGLGRYSLEAEQVFLTPEFNGGRKHLWFRIKNIFYLN